MPNLFGELTEEELRSQSENFGDMEFEAEVAAAQGPFGESEISADRMTAVLYPQRDLVPSLRGAAINNSTLQILKGSDEQKKHLAKSIDPLMGDSGYTAAGLVDETVERDDASVFTFGAKNTTPRVQSHEVRHLVIDTFRNLKLPDVKMPEGVTGLFKKLSKEQEMYKAKKFLKESMPSDRDEENWNRAFDRYRTEDPMVLIEDVIQRHNKAKKGTSLKDKKVFNDYMETTLFYHDRDAKKFAEIEAASQILEGQPAPKGGWEMHYLNEFKKRRKKLEISIPEKYKEMSE